MGSSYIVLSILASVNRNIWYYKGFRATYSWKRMETETDVQKVKKCMTNKEKYDIIVL